MKILTDSINWLNEQSIVTPNFIERWSEPWRVYHGIGHIEQMLWTLGDVDAYYNLSNYDYKLLTLGAWYHDIVYVPGAADNEEKSGAAAWAEQSGLGMILNQLVMVTKTHEHAHTFVEGLLIDMDLQGLGGGEDVYYKNNVKVRAEYGDKITDLQWLAGRIAFLESFLNRSHIYFTAWGAQYELPARHAMNAELQALKGL